MLVAGRWSDLSDWAAVWRETQEYGVSLFGPATAIDCHDTLLRSEAPEQGVVGIGLDDIVAAAMPDAVLISYKGRTQEVKQAEAAPQAEAFLKDHHPRGWFERLVIGDRFQVKRIVVHLGAALFLQSHHHRSEHWIVVQGIAKVTVDADVKLVSENQSVYIPLGATHRMETPGKVRTVLIEVQTGSSPLRGRHHSLRRRLCADLRRPKGHACPACRRCIFTHSDRYDTSMMSQEERSRRHDL